MLGRPDNGIGIEPTWKGRQHIDAAGTECERVSGWPPSWLLPNVVTLRRAEDCSPDGTCRIGLARGRRLGLRRFVAELDVELCGGRGPGQSCGRLSSQQHRAVPARRGFCHGCVSRTSGRAWIKHRAKPRHRQARLIRASRAALDFATQRNHFNDRRNRFETNGRYVYGQPGRLETPGGRDEPLYSFR